MQAYLTRIVVLEILKTALFYAQAIHDAFRQGRRYHLPALSGAFLAIVLAAL
ncbi:hypothetical protein ACT3T8_16080 [Halomonas sp. AOP1-B1-8]|uniref:hypothetical protein n=1 Tax=Halomonas sp. AOP1-B1-8 TaxID=3457726 RepID=UPI003FDA8B38